MRKINEIYDIMDEVRERIIKTMDERGIKEVVFCPDKEKWLEDNPDKYEEDYDEYQNEACPWVVIFDKYGAGYDYRVYKIVLVPLDKRTPDYAFEVFATDDECGQERDTSEYNVMWLTMIHIYEALERELNL